MLNPFIIDQIRRREQEKGFEQQVQLELPKPDPKCYPATEKEEEPERGVVIIDVWG